jgi:hypothetical protein
MPNPKTANLEISLHNRGTDPEKVSYSIDFRFWLPDNEAEANLNQDHPNLAHFDLKRLKASSQDSIAYGRLLTEALFADPVVKDKFVDFRNQARLLNAALRLRLMIGPSAPELHNLRWETLCDPENGSFLCTNTNLYFSRYLSSSECRPIRLRSKGRMNALVMIASPSDLHDYSLQDIDVNEEFKRIDSALGGIAATHLTGGQPARHATLDAMIKCMREKEFDILYLVCHGEFVEKDQDTFLYLEDENGRAKLVPGSEFVNRLKDMQQQLQPRLIVLVSCESAGNSVPGRDGALASLGPRLAQCGIPAVIAMQYRVSFETIQKFMPAFFEELQNSEGEIDRAFTLARDSVRDQVMDFWVPVLFLRLAKGFLWSSPGFQNTFDKWPGLIMNIHLNKCIPILGAGLVEPILGSSYEMARRWSDVYNYPMESSACESLPEVAQFMSITQDDPTFPLSSLDESLKNNLFERYENVLAGCSKFDPLDKIISSVWQSRQANNGDALDPLKILARLPFPIYITTNYDNLITEALISEGRDPQVVVFPWNDELLGMKNIYDREPDYVPDLKRPLVYHLFGRYEIPESIVLKEDDYYDYLMSAKGKDRSIPDEVSRALADNSLLFIGFRLDDWNFRILLRSLLSSEGSPKRRGANVAAQMEPEEGRMQEPEGARRFMESYFKQAAKINLYWGSAEDFLGELFTHWKSGS